MPRGFLDDADRAALAGAVATVETSSAAEVVVAVRARARIWLHAHLLVGLAVAWAALGFMMYSAHPFGLVAILIDPLVAGALGALASMLFPAVGRVLTPAAIRRRAVAQAARATFVERGVHHTSGRTGVLVYVALAERMAELVADDGVVRNAEPTAWGNAGARIDAAVARGGGALAEALRGLAPVLATALPRHVEDINELPDAVDDDSAEAR